MYCDSFHLGSGVYFVLVIACANCFIISPESKEGAEGIGTVAHYNRGTMGVTKVEAVPVGELNVHENMISDVT